MKPEDFEALLRAEVEDAKSHYERVKAALETYLLNDRSNTKQVDPTSERPVPIAVHVRRVVSQMDEDKIFGIEDVFHLMDDPRAFYL